MGLWITHPNPGWNLNYNEGEACLFATRRYTAGGGSITAVRTFLLATWFACSCAGAALTGRVTDELGNPIPRATAILISRSDPNARYLAHTETAGIFRLSAIAPGDYWFELYSTGFAPLEMDSLPVGPSEEQTPRPFVLKTGPVPLNACGSGHIGLLDLRLLRAGDHKGNIAGTVVHDQSGRPARGVILTLTCGGDRACRKSKTDSRGQYLFPDLAPGIYGLKIAQRGMYPEAQSGLAAREDLELVYAPIALERCRNGNCDPRFRPSNDPRPLICP